MEPAIYLFYIERDVKPNSIIICNPNGYNNNIEISKVATTLKKRTKILAVILNKKDVLKSFVYNLYSLYKFNII